jgi:hypothetical protein
MLCFVVLLPINDQQPSGKQLETRKWKVAGAQQGAGAIRIFQSVHQAGEEALGHRIAGGRGTTFDLRQGKDARPPART